jgi:hypothetical protein
MTWGGRKFQIISYWNVSDYVSANFKVNLFYLLVLVSSKALVKPCREHSFISTLLS